MHAGSAYVTKKCIFHVLLGFDFAGLTLTMQYSVFAIDSWQILLLMQKQ